MLLTQMNGAWQMVSSGELFFYSTWKLQDKSILLIHKEIVLEKTSNSQVYKTKPL